MFTAGLALLVPAAYAYHCKQEAYKQILVSCALLMLPALPHALETTARSAWNALTQIFKAPARAATWNYAFKILNPARLTQIEEKDVTRSQAIVLAALSWIVIPIVATIPYLSIGLNPLDAFFESVSGWTSTGLSAIPDLSGVPTSILFYRSFTQWLGGVGIIIFALFVLRAPAAGKMLRAEGHSLTEPNARKTAKIIWAIYALLTAIGIGLAVLAGLTLFDAVNLVMTAVATGGFTPTNELAFTLTQKLVFVVLMLAGATSFTLHYKLLTGNVRAFLKNSEFKAMLFLAGAFTILLYATSGAGFANALFQTASALTGTGFSVENIGAWTDFPKYLLALLMISGGCSGSTTGAVKLWRVLTLAKNLWIRVKRVFLPSGVVQVVKVNETPLSNEDVIESGNFIFIYFAVLGLAAAALMALGFTAITSAFAAASALGNVGLAPIAIHALPAAGKLVLIACMWLGRIEILPSIVLAAFLIKKYS